MSEKLSDDMDLVMSVLSDVLGENRFSKIDINDVLKELSEVEGEDEFDYTGSYHPYKRIDSVVKHFVSKYKKRKHNEEKEKEFEKSKNAEEEVDSDSEMINAEIMIEVSDKQITSLLTSLITVYPDVDPKLLQQICNRFHHDATKIQDWLETNIDSIPEKRQVQAINRFALESTCKSEEQIWKCPICEMWQIIDKKVAIAKCTEAVSCGEFCIKCNRKAHSPFKCRQKCQRIDKMENEMDIFKKLKTLPDEDKGYAKIFILRPQNNLNFSDPLHILYLAAEGTFLRMMEMSNQVQLTSTSGGWQTHSLAARISSLFSPRVSNGMASTSASNIPSRASSSSATAQGHPMSIQAVNPTQQLLQHLPSASASVSAMPLPQINNVFPSVAPNTIGISTLAVSSSSSPTPSSTPAANTIQQSLQRLPSTTSTFPTLSSSRGYSRRSGLNNPISMGGKSIKAIKYIENESLRGRFNSCKSYFLSRSIPNDERLVFHGTSADLDSIIKQNLKLSLCKRFAFGKGVYFSEFPSTSQVYGKHLLLFRVMLGNPYQGREHIIPAQYQSKIVQPNEEGKANMIIIDNEDQILPAFIIELQDLEPPVSI
eukprot:GFUD01002380.1.p1 GENE.GFUD01002380.1~~GFUD01002380.1.p1  ORF type:complete len:597 (-),score=140.23 GFUD01002380.1:94-1884(-)